MFYAEYYDRFEGITPLKSEGEFSTRQLGSQGGSTKWVNIKERDLWLHNEAKACQRPHHVAYRIYKGGKFSNFCHNNGEPVTGIINYRRNG